MNIITDLKFFLPYQICFNVIYGFILMLRSEKKFLMTLYLCMFNVSALIYFLIDKRKTLKKTARSK